MGIGERDRILEAFSWELDPLQNGRGDAIAIDPSWVARNIVRACVPQLRGIRGAPASGCVEVHRVAAPALQRLFAAWEHAGLLPLVRSFGGSAWDPRLARGTVRPRRPSMHAYGVAFDLNIDGNPWDTDGAPTGAPGSVWPLVPIAEREGWFWGGRWPHPGRDPMHFELGVQV